MMGCHNFVLLFYSAWLLFYVGASDLQSSQVQVLLQLKEHLEYPWQLEIWKDHWTDFCAINSHVNVSCQDNLVTGLSILSDKPAKVRDFDGFSVPNQTLSENFSMDSFVATLARLTSLKVLRLVSLGIWGPLPDKIHRLFALEDLDLSSNFLYGSIPPKIFTMLNLQVLRLDDNFFNRTIPNCFNLLSNLTILGLKNNRLQGQFPPSILSITTLINIDMSSNEISGKLPDFSSLKSLEQLDLRENRLHSELPEMPKGLVTVFLSKNSFSGEIPRQYGQLVRLQKLDISFNTQTDKPAAELFSLPNISYLNLASNLLSGSLPNLQSCGRELRFVDVSHNRLVGGLPSCLSNKSENRIIKSEGNCLSGYAQHQQAESFCNEAHMKKNQSRVEILVCVIVGTIIIIINLTLGFFIVCRRYCLKGISEQHQLHKTDSAAAGSSSGLLMNTRFNSQTSKLSRQDIPVCRPYSYEELKAATNNFDNSTFMGENLYGNIYRGRLENGMEVAIRCLPLSKKYSIRNFRLRLDLLAKLRHPNLVALLGHCMNGVVGEIDGGNIFLVYEYVPNGSFQNYLSGNIPGKVFNWSERLAVLTGVAKAVHFLHTGMIPGLLNNRLKTNNILLTENWMPKLSDYGLSIISEAIDINGVKGESPLSGQIKMSEDDVYSFGSILLEALVGPSVSRRKETMLVDVMASFNSQVDGWKQIVDPIVQATGYRESLSIVISITNKCLSPELWSRPSIEDVLWNLQYASQIQATVGDQKSAMLLE